MKKQKGFTLIETTIVLIILTAAMIYGAKLFRDRSKQISKDRIYSLWATEYQQMYDVLDNYIADNFDSIPMDTVQQIGASSLATQGYLPSGFGSRFGSNNTAPLGGKFKFNYMKYNYDLNGDGNAVPIVSGVMGLTIGASLPEIYLEPALAKLDMKITDSNRENVTQNIAYELFNYIKPEYLGGILDIDVDWIDGVNSSFARDFSQFLYSYYSGRNYYVPMLVWGFPDINGCGGGVNCGDGGGNGDGDPDPNELYANCIIDARPVENWCTACSPDRYVYDSNTTCEAHYNGAFPRTTLFTTYGLNAPGFEYVEAWAMMGRVNSTEHAGNIGAYSGVASQCSSIAESNRQMINTYYGTGNDEGKAYHDSSLNACMNSPVYSSFEEGMIGGGVVQSNKFEDKGSYKFPPCGVPVSGCGNQIVEYEKYYQRKYMSICCPVQ